MLGGMENRLSGETSPYLLQHKDNPINWQPWDEKALLLARELDRPIFLSVGYSSCHWCHVMAHESFEDQEVADALNKHFVCIKLDREERPDIDEIYMTAVQVATGHGGWPMSVFLTPDLKPFFAGTYFPRSARGGNPGFLNVVHSLAQAWNEKRGEINAAADQFAGALQQMIGRSMYDENAVPSVRLLDEAIQVLHQDFDYENGGFGNAPKFPPHAGTRFMLEYAALRHAIDTSAEDLMEAAGTMALMTLERMALGGIHDHVGGGFHRYSTDAQWLVPHFEKMLNDNGQLLWCYSLASDLVEDEPLKSLFAAARQGIIDWVRDEMTSPEGLFYAAMDADSEGEEGLYYTWTPAEIHQVLAENADEFIFRYNVVEGGNYLVEHTSMPNGRSIPHLADHRPMTQELLILREVRNARVKPGLDSKCIVGWNGLMIGGLAKAGEVEMAARCADFWVDAFERSGSLPRQYCAGRLSGTGFLEDYAYLIEGLLDLFEATGYEKWRDSAARLAVAQQEKFGDQAHGGFFFIPEDGQDIFGRSRPFLDGANPSPNGSAIRGLVKLNMEPQKHFQAALPWAQSMPQASETFLTALLYYFVQHPEAQTLEPTPVAKPVFENIHVSMSPREINVDKEGWGHAIVTITMPDGLHINSNDPPAKWLIPTTMRVEGVLGEAGFPEPENDMYKGTVNFPIRLRPSNGTEEFQLTVRYQPCTDSECLGPQERVLSGVVIVNEPK